MVEESNFPHMLRAFIVITLFAFLLLVIVNNFAGNYDVDTTIINERIGSSKINSTLASTQNASDIWKLKMESFGEGNVFEKLLDILGFMSVGMFNLGIQMFGFITLPFEILSNVLVNVLGVPTIVVTIMLTLILLTALFGIWSLVKRGV